MQHGLASFPSTASQNPPLPHLTQGYGMTSRSSFSLMQASGAGGAGGGGGSGGTGSSVGYGIANGGGGGRGLGGAACPGVAFRFKHQSGHEPARTPLDTGNCADKNIAVAMAVAAAVVVVVVVVVVLVVMVLVVVGWSLLLRVPF